MNNIIVSVPGKIHLIGEHTVVYGKPALLSAINLRVHIGIQKAKLATKVSGKIAEVKRIVETLIKKNYQIKTFPPYTLSLTSHIPFGAGLGSSAAISAGYSAALLEFLKIPWDKQSVNELAFEADKIFNGNPSGGDNTTVVYGGMLKFQKEKEFENIAEHIPHTFFLINSGKPDETTAEMVKKVSVFSKKYPDVFQKILRDQEALTSHMQNLLRKKKQDALFAVIQQAEENLESLGVVSQKAKLIIYSLKRIGVAAKISGAGGIQNGSGMIICLPKDEESFIHFAKQNKFDYQKITIGEEGLRKEA